MRKKISALVTIAALVIGVAVFAAPAISYAGTITDITVTNGPGIFTGGAAGTTWTFAPIVLADGETAVLTQNQAALGGIPGFNFDTSDFGVANYTVTVNGTPLVDLGILNFGGADDPNSTTINEAANWVFIGSVCSGIHCLDVFTGYADTLHSGACNDGGDCLPSDGVLPFFGATVFLGNGSTPPDGYPASPHCTTSCFDGGAILLRERVLVQTPEPSSLILLGVGLMGLVYGRRYLKKNS